MNTAESTRPIAGILLVVALALNACGGGGGGGGGGNGTQNNPPPVNTPTLPPTPVPTLIVLSGDIASTAKLAPPGATVIVAPGIYTPFTLNAGDLQGPLTIIADVTGQLTGSPAAAVTILGASHPAGIVLVGQTQVTIDGFTVRGGNSGGIFVQDGSEVTVQNCIVSASSADGISFQGVTGGLIFNNLVFNNAREGIGAFGTTDLRIINNTVFHSGESGIFIGFDDVSMSPSMNVFLRNNITTMNQRSMGIVVDSGDPTSLTGYDGDYNLNTDGYTGPQAGRFDLRVDPIFISPGGASPDFHLLGPDLTGSGGSPAINAGDPATDSDLAAALSLRTTQNDLAPDVPPVDIGYHYAGAFFAPTPTATRTVRPTSAATGGATRTPTRSPGAGGTATPTRSGASVTSTPTPTPTPTRRGPQHSPTRTRVGG